MPVFSNIHQLKYNSVCITIALLVAVTPRVVAQPSAPTPDTSHRATPAVYFVSQGSQGERQNTSAASEDRNNGNKSQIQMTQFVSTANDTRVNNALRSSDSPSIQSKPASTIPFQTQTEQNIVSAVPPTTNEGTIKPQQPSLLPPIPVTMSQLAAEDAPQLIASRPADNVNPPITNQSIVNQTLPNPPTNTFEETLPLANTANTNNQIAIDDEFGNDVAASPRQVKPDAILDKSFNTARKEKPAKSLKDTASIKWAPLVSTFGGLVLVLGLFFLFVFIMKRAAPKGNSQLPKELAEHLGRVPLTQKVQLHLLRIGDRLILLSVTAEGATPISEITDKDEVVRLLGYCRKYDKNSSTASFQQILNGYMPDEEAPKDSKATESLTGLLASGITNQTRKRAKAG